MSPAAKKLLFFPAVVMALVASAAYVVAGPGAAKGALFGGFVAVCNAGMIGWRMGRGGNDPDAHRHLQLAYRASVERFLLVCALLAAGLGLLRLAPLYLVGGFVAGQLALMVSSVLTWKSVAWLPDSRRRSSTSSTTSRT